MIIVPRVPKPYSNLQGPYIKALYRCPCDLNRVSFRENYGGTIHFPRAISGYYYVPALYEGELHKGP